MAIMTDGFLPIQHRVRTDAILVSVPRRTCLLIAAANCSDKTLLAFKRLYDLNYEDDSFGNKQLAKGVFTITDGRIEKYTEL